MSGTKWFGYSAKRLDFSAFKGGGKTEYLIAAVLGLVILGAAYGIYRGIAGPSQPTGPDWFKYKCEKCNYEFVVKVKDLPKAQHMADERDVMKLNCPNCKAEHSSWREIECPNCHTYFVPQSEKDRYAAFSSGRPDFIERPQDPNAGRDICPKCGTDINKWWVEHKKK